MATEKELAQEMEELRQRLQDLNRQTQESTGFFKSLGTELLGTKKSFGQFKTELGGSIGKGISDVGSSLLSFATTVGSGNTKFASMNGVIDSVTGALGGMLSAIPVVGTALSGMAKAIGEVGKFVVQQMDVVTDAFEDLGKVGALTSRGMSGLVDQFTASKMTMEGYKKVVTENADSLARFGGIAGAGAERFAKAVGTISTVELRRLGMSADQIGEAAAGFLKNQSILGRANVLTQNQLVSGSKAYALELDQLAKLTGANREELMKQQQAALREGRYLAVRSELEDQGRVKAAKNLDMFQSVISKAAPTVGKGLRDLSTGMANTAEGQALVSATNGEAQDILDRLLSDQIDYIQATAELQASLKRTKEPLRDFAKGVGDDTKTLGIFAENTAVMGLQFDDAGKVIEQVNQTQEAQKKGGDALTEQVVNAKMALEQFHREMFNIAVGMMPQAAQALHQLTMATREFVQYISKVIGKELGGEGGSSLRKGLQLVGGGLGAAAGVVGSGVLAGATGGAGILATGALVGGGTALGVGLGNSIADMLGAGPGGLGREFGIGGPGSGPLFGGGGGGADAVLDFGARTGDRQHFDQLEPGMQQALIQAGQQYQQATGGKKLKIESAFRSPEEQAKVDSGGRPKAAPGRSMHNVGSAVDIANYNDPAAVKAMNAVGLFNRLDNDKPHFSPTGYAFGGIASGPMSGYTSTLHGDEAVIPLAGGRSVPVDMSAFAGRLQEQIGLLADQNSMIGELITLMSSNNSINNKILQAARG